MKTRVWAKTISFLTAAAMILLVASCESDPADDASSAGSVTSSVSSAQSTSEPVAPPSEPDPIPSDDVSSEEEDEFPTTWVDPPHYEPLPDPEIVNVSAADKGKDAGISLNDALNTYLVSVNDGKIYVWQDSENTGKNGVDVKVLVYNESRKRMEHVLSFTVENKEYREFDAANAAFYQYYLAQSDVPGAIYNSQLRIGVYLTEDEPRVEFSADEFDPLSQPDPTHNPVEYGGKLSIKDGIYDVWSAHPDYGRVEDVRTRGNYAIYLFNSSEDFTKSTDTLAVYDYTSGKLTVLAVVPPEEAMVGFEANIGGRFLDDEWILVTQVRDHGHINSVYNAKTEKSIVLPSVSSYLFAGNGVVKLDGQKFRNCVIWPEASDRLLSYDVMTGKTVDLVKDEGIFMYETVGNKFYIKTGECDYSTAKGNIYVSADGNSVKKIAEDVYNYYFVGEKILYVQKETGDGFTWEKITL